MAWQNAGNSQNCHLHLCLALCLRLVEFLHRAMVEDQSGYKPSGNKELHSERYNLSWCLLLLLNGKDLIWLMTFQAKHRIEFI